MVKFFVTLQRNRISSLAVLQVVLFHKTRVIIYDLCEEVKLQIISLAQRLLISCVSV